MNEYIREQIGDHVLEYYDETHLYLVDGLIVPSIASLLLSLGTVRKSSEKRLESLLIQMKRQIS